MSQLQQAFKYCLPFFILAVLLIFTSRSNAFFWDTLLQSSRWADYFYQTQFKSIFLPAAMDAGHPPFFAYYLAIVWVFFGKSLVISHFAVLPFVIGIIWQVYRIVTFFFDPKYVGWVMALILTDATLMAQSSLVSPDLVLLFGFLLAVNGVLHQKNGLIVFGTAAAALVSIRGIFTIAVIGLMHQLFLYYFMPKRGIQKHLKSFAPYLPVALMMGVYYYMHYLHSGWFISTPNEAWSQHREMESFGGILKNAGILGWRIMDFGRVAIVFIFGISLLLAIFRKLKLDHHSRFLIGSMFLFILVYSPGILLIRNPISHRYLMPLFILITLATAYFVFHQIPWEKWAKPMVIFFLLVQLSGNFWVYPRHIAQGWDASLAYLPYFELRHDMLDYLAGQKIPINQVGTEFPNIGPRKNMDLNEIETGFILKDLDQQDYIFYSNVFNDFSDEALTRLDTDFEAVKTFRKRQVYITLYKKR